MYRLPASLRPRLAQPFGPVLTTQAALEATNGRVVLAVGDVVTRMFLEAGVVPRVMVVDGITKRGVEEVGNVLGRLPRDARRVEVENPAAEITGALLDALRKAARETQGCTLIHVHGEEDLAALPAMIFAPDEACVAYGQPDQGVVVVTVTPSVRKRAEDLLREMDTS